MSLPNEDRFDTGRLRNPAYDAAAVTPNDAADLPRVPARGLYVGVSGDVKVDMQGGGTVVFKAVPVGVLNVRVTRVYATGTAATNILALY